MIILEILKIIGIVLACIIGFVLLLLLIVSFVPIRYQMKAEGENAEIEGGAKVTWFLKLAKACVSWEDKKLRYRVSIFGKAILQGTLGETEAETLRGQLEEEETASDPKRQEQLSRQLQKAEIKAEKEEKLQQVKEEEKEKQKEEKKKKKEEEKAERKKEAEGLSVQEKLQGIRDRIQAITEKIEEAKRFWEARTTQRAVRHIKTNLFRILNHVKPRTIAGMIRFGLKDPADTAILYGSAAPLLEAAGNGKLTVIPEFYVPGISVNLAIKGRFFIGYMLLCAVSIYLNRDVQRLIRFVRRKLNG